MGDGGVPPVEAPGVACIAVIGDVPTVGDPPTTVDPVEPDVVDCVVVVPAVVVVPGVAGGETTVTVEGDARSGVAAGSDNSLTVGPTVEV